MLQARAVKFDYSGVGFISFTPNQKEKKNHTQYNNKCATMRDPIIDKKNHVL